MKVSCPIGEAMRVWLGSLGSQSGPGIFCLGLGKHAGRLGREGLCILGDACITPAVGLAISTLLCCLYLEVGKRWLVHFGVLLWGIC